MEDNFLQKSRKKPFWSYVFFVLGVLLLIFILSATLFGIIFLQEVDESLDIRKQALVVNKRVDFNTFPFSQSFFQVGEKNKIELQINTYNHYVDALELNLNLKTDAGLWQEAELKISSSPDQALKLIQSDVQKTSCDPQHDCYLATLLLISQEPTTPFTSRNLSTSIANLEFIPQKEGSIVLQLAQTSQINEHGTGQNILHNAAAKQFDYYVSNNGIDFAQCRYVYGEWSACENFWQTREYQVAPLNCHWHQQETLEPLSRQCVELDEEQENLSLAKSTDFFLHYFATCLNNPSQGEKFYLVWNTEQYDYFNWLDVSLDHQFTNFYQKSTKTAERIGKYAIIDLSDTNGFSPSLKGQQLTLRADQRYYFRLYNDQTEEAVYGPQLYLNYCPAQQSRNLNCQDTCIQTQQGSNCADGLTCIDGKCSLESNPQNQWCFDPNLISDAKNLGSVAGVSTQLSDTTYIIQGPFLPSEIYDLTTYACNHGCNTNRDCMADYRCYQGRCRLASNPESPTCEPADGVLISEPLEPKGGSLEEDPLPSPTSSPLPTSTVEPEISTAAAKVDTPPPTSESEPITEEAVSTQDQEEKLNIFSNMFANISATFKNFSNAFNWQYLALAGLLIVIALVFIILGLSHDPRQVKKKNKKIAEHTDQIIEDEETVIPENKKLDL